MKRKVISVLISVVIVVSLFSGLCSASAVDVNSTTGTQTCAAGTETAKLYIMVAIANATIESLVKIAQLTPYDDVAWLLSMVDAIVNPIFAYAASIGATVACEYVEYQIDGQSVLIDPIRVVNL